MLSGARPVQGGRPEPQGIHEGLQLLSLIGRQVFVSIAHLCGFAGVALREY